MRARAAGAGGDGCKCARLPIRRGWRGWRGARYWPRSSALATQTGAALICLRPGPARPGPARPDPLIPARPDQTRPDSGLGLAPGPPLCYFVRPARPCFESRSAAPIMPRRPDPPGAGAALPTPPATVAMGASAGSGRWSAERIRGAARILRRRSSSRPAGRAPAGRSGRRMRGGPGCRRGRVQLRSAGRDKSLSGPAGVRRDGPESSLLTTLPYCPPSPRRRGSPLSRRRCAVLAVSWEGPDASERRQRAIAGEYVCRRWSTASRMQPSAVAVTGLLRFEALAGSGGWVRVTVLSL